MKNVNTPSLPPCLGKLQEIRGAVINLETNFERTYQALVEDFLSDFLDSLDAYPNILQGYNERSTSQEETDEILKKMRKTKDSFLDFWDVYVRYSPNPDHKIILSFIEDLIEKQGTMNNNHSLKIPLLFKLFNYEFFLSLVAILLKYKKFGFLGKFLSHEYSFYCEHFRQSQEHLFPFFNDYPTFFEKVQKKRLPQKEQRHDLLPFYFMDDWDKSNKLKYKEIQQADLVLWYVSMIYRNRFGNKGWFPYTTVKDRLFLTLPFFRKIRGEDKFSYLLSLFNLKDKTSLKEEVANAEQMIQKYYGFQFRTEYFSISHGLGIARWLQEETKI